MDPCFEATTAISSETPAAASWPSESSPSESAPLRRLSDSIGSLLGSSDLEFCSDAKIVVGADKKEVRVHRCVLSARSSYFREIFAKGAEILELSKLVSKFEVSYDALMTVLGYLYSGIVGALPRGICECVDEECTHEACWPAVDFMLQVLYSSFVFQIHELVRLFQRHLLDILDKVAIDDMPVILEVANFCGKDCTRLYSKSLNAIVYSGHDIVTLKKRLIPDIVNQITESRKSLGFRKTDDHVKKIYNALDLDDVVLVKLLMEEQKTTLDDAYALHYAVSHCNPEITRELLKLGPADVNRKNLRDYSVLHVAAMRKEPDIIICLLENGAKLSDVTPEGKNALQIVKRLTKAIEYLMRPENSNSSPKGRLCIEILEQAERTDQELGEIPISHAFTGDHLFQKLSYFEYRVYLAKLFFPEEAKVAMANAHVHGTLVFSSIMLPYISVGELREDMNTNEITSDVMENLLSRLKALEKTVELGMRFFRRCSSVLDTFLDLRCDWSEPTHLADNSEGLKRIYWELDEEINKAYLKDKEELDGVLPGSISSKSARQGRSKRRRR